MSRQTRLVPQNYYVYLIKADNVPRYAGSGHGYRVFDHLKKSARSLVSCFLPTSLSYEILAENLTKAASKPEISLLN
jgi:hypothetical protein